MNPPHLQALQGNPNSPPDLQLLFLEFREHSPAALEEELATLKEKHPLIFKKLCRLIHAHHRVPDNFFENLISNAIATLTESDPQPKQAYKLTDFLPFEILSSLGQGGMGHVYLAFSKKPPHRRVALKVLPYKNPRLLSRFAREVQTLARLSHNHIARVYEVGETKQHIPFFTMEFIDGMEIDQFVQKKQLSVSDRLSLFLQVCFGIRYAHQNRVIHRDIKPSNILVIDEVSGPIVKIIDFGINLDDNALLEEEDLTDFFVGTPAYMAPEQQQGESKETDARADVFGLGRLLYALLLDRHPPLSMDGNKNVHPVQALSLLSDPPPYQNESIHKVRNNSPQRKRVDADLEAVFQKACAHKRKDRYQSVDSLIHDVEAWLNFQPVSARRADNFHRFRLHFRGHPYQFLAVIVCTLFLLSGISLIWKTRLDADRTRSRIHQTETELKHQLRLFKMTFSKAGTYFQNQTLSFKNFLSQVEKGIDEENGIAINFRLDLYNFIGGIYLDIGENYDAQRIFKKSMELAQSAQNLEALVHAKLLLCDAYIQFGDADKALSALPNNPQSLTKRHQLRYRLIQSQAYRLQHKIDEAHHGFKTLIPKFKQEFGRAHRLTLVAMEGMALTLRYRGEYQAALELTQEVLHLRSRSYDRGHPIMQSMRQNLANLYQDLGQLEKAEALLVENVEVFTEQLGPQHQQTLLSIHNLAYCLFRSSRYEEAGALFQQAVDGLTSLFGEDAYFTSQALKNQARNDFMIGRFERAEQTFHRLYMSVATSSFPNPSDLQGHALNWGLSLLFTQQYAKAVKILSQALLLPDHRNTHILADLHLTLARTLISLDRHHEADHHLEEAEQLFSSTSRPDHAAIKFTRVFRAYNQYLIQPDIALSEWSVLMRDFEEPDYMLPPDLAEMFQCYRDKIRSL